MTFRDLHHRDTPLLLPNAWDVPSALAFLEAGFEAIGTTSFGVASSLGRSDGSRATRERNLSLASELARLPCHISLDIEDGYTDDPDELAEYVAELGVAGINIEDSTAGRLISPQVHVAKVAAIKRRCPDLFLNARVDTYWMGENATVDATLERAAQYVEAGADGIFVPGVSDPSVIRELAAGAAVPLNVLVVPALSLDELGALGVRRVSTGSLPYRAAIDTAVDVARAVRDGRPIPSATSYADMQARLLQHAARVPRPDARKAPGERDLP